MRRRADVMTGLPVETPESAAASLSMDQALLLRSQLAIGRHSMLVSMSKTELLQLQAKWTGPNPPAELTLGKQSCRAYIERQRMALELRYQQHQLQQTAAQQVGAAMIHLFRHVFELIS